MKRLFLIFMILCIAAIVTADTVVVVGQPRVVAGPSYDFQETFETNPGYDKTWTENTGNPDEDASTTGLSLQGSQCLSMAAATIYNIRSSNFTAYPNNVYISFMFRMADATPTDDVTIFRMYAGSNGVLSLYVKSDGSMRLYPTGGSSFTVLNNAGETAYMANNTTAYFWITTNGSNSVSVYVAATGTKPDNGATGTLVEAGDFTQVRLESSATYNQGLMYFDDLRIDDAFSNY